MAANLAMGLGCRIGIIRLLNENGEWRHGYFGESGGGRLLEQSIAQVCEAYSGPLIVEDTRSHARLQHHPLVTTLPGIASFAGIAIREHEESGTPGALLGIACVMSHEPHIFPEQTDDFLENSALMLQFRKVQIDRSVRLIEKNYELVAKLADTDRMQRQMRQAEKAALFGTWRVTLDDYQGHLSKGIYAIHEIPFDQPLPFENSLGFYAPEYRAEVSRTIERAIETGESWDMEADFISAKGTRKRLRAIGEVELKDGKPAALVGVLMDVSDRHALEQELRRQYEAQQLNGLPLGVGLAGRIIAKG